MKHDLIRFVSLMLVVLMLFTVPVQASFASEEDGLYLDMPDGKYSMAQLYQDCVDQWGEPYSGSKYSGYYYATARLALNYTPITSNGDAGLTPGSQYWIWKTTENASGDGDRVYVGSIYTRSCYRICARLSSGAPEGAHVSVSPERVFSGQSVCITASEVDGYHVTMTCGSTAVNAAVYTYTPSACDEWTVTYVSNGTTVPATALTIENDDTMGLCQAEISDDQSYFTLTIHPANEQGYFVSEILLNGGENLLGSAKIGAHGSVTLGRTALLPNQENTLSISYERTCITVTPRNLNSYTGQDLSQQESAILDMIQSTHPSSLPEGRLWVEYQPFGDLSQITLPTASQFPEDCQWVALGTQVDLDRVDPVLWQFYHAFGQPEETVRICYRSTDDRFVATSDPFTLTLLDMRSATELRLNSDVCVTYGAIEEAALLEALVDGVYANDTKLPDATVTLETDLSALHAGSAVAVTVAFAGNEDYSPCKAQGCLTILPALAEFSLTDACVTYDRAGHGPTVVNPRALPYLTLIADASHVTIRFPETLKDIAALLPTPVSVAELEAALSGTLSTQALAHLRAAVQDLGAEMLFPTDDAPSRVGSYSVRAVTCAGDYESILAQAALTIQPISVQLTLDDQSKLQQAPDPELTWRSNFDEVGLPGDRLVVTPTRVSGESVGEYAITATAYVAEDSGSYDITVFPGTLHITPAQTPTPSGYYLSFDDATDDTGLIAPGAQIEIDGVAHTLDEHNALWLSGQDSKIAVAYRFHSGSTAHETYPTGMYVWYLDFDGKAYHAQRIVELDDILKYEGTSIRVNFSSNGIRFFSSIPSSSLNDLIRGDLLTGTLAGFKIEKAGTLYKKWSGSGDVLTTATGVSSDVFGGKAGSSFRVFSTANGRSWFTGMLTGLKDDAATLDMDILSRPYITLTRGTTSITLYGGTVRRSIYYVATQNRDYWSAGSAQDNFVESLIATVEAARKN